LTPNRFRSFARANQNGFRPISLPWVQRSSLTNMRGVNCEAAPRGGAYRSRALVFAKDLFVAAWLTYFFVLNPISTRLRIRGIWETYAHR
jgi:hypothetical protein